MTRDQILDELRVAGFKPTSATDTSVTAERGIAGHTGWYRAVVVTGWDRDWRCTMYLKRPRPASLTEFEYARSLAERNCIASVEHLGLFLSGAVSQPVDEREVRALTMGTAA